MNENDGELGSFLAGFVIGGLVGAAVALILAPKSGAETRSQITDKGRDLRDAGEQRFNSAVEYADDYAHQVGERASQFGHEVENQARIVLDSGRQSQNQADDDDSPSAANAENESEAAPN